MGHPSATIFRHDLCERVFQQPQAITLRTQNRRLVGGSSATRHSPTMKNRLLIHIKFKGTGHLLQAVYKA
jgi:hypothetical protein